MKNINTITIKYKKNHNDLSNLAKNYGSDKGSPIDNDTSISGWRTHLYTDFYNLLFFGMRNKTINLLEIGLGTNNEDVPSNMRSTGQPGASLRAFRDYFPNATIYGADVDERVLFEEERIKTFYVDQTNPDSIAEMFWKIGAESFDIILDDGLHTGPAAINLLEHSFYKLKTGGIYIIEDVMYHWQEVKNHLEGNGYNFIHVDFNNDASQLFVIFKD